MKEVSRWEKIKNDEELHNLIKKRRRKYYYKNKKKLLQKQREYRKKNKDKIFKRKIEYRKKNKNKIKKLKKEYYIKNKKKILDSQKKNLCLDCGNNIHKISKRCRKCAMKFRRTIKRPYEIGEKIRKCSCGCGEYIIYNRSHIYNGITKTILGHSRPSKRKGKGKIYLPRNCLNCEKNLSRIQLRAKKRYCSEECSHKGMSENTKKSRKKQIFPVKDTKIEVKIQNLLKQIGIHFMTHKYMNIKYGYQCDIFIPVQEGINQKTIIECDGDYWHGNLEVYPIKRFTKRILSNRCLDYERTAQLEEAGFRVIRLWEHEINSDKIYTTLLNKLSVQEILN